MKLHQLTIEACRQKKKKKSFLIVCVMVTFSMTYCSFFNPSAIKHRGNHQRSTSDQLNLITLSVCVFQRIRPHACSAAPTHSNIDGNLIRDLSCEPIEWPIFRAYWARILCNNFEKCVTPVRAWAHSAGEQLQLSTVKEDKTKAKVHVT